MRYPHFAVAAFKTVVNAVCYVVSGRVLLLEGRWWRGFYSNWSGDRRFPSRLVSPESEAEVVDIVRDEPLIRVVGAGHSFNDGLATEGATLSLDALAGVVHIDHEAKRATVWAGTRLRDLTPVLLAEGLAFRSLASHDAQSVAGILSTDVHGTARGPAHFSDHVVSMRLVDGTGELHTVGPNDELFRAAVGGIGAVGIITQVTVQCVDAFDLRQTTMVETRGWAERNLERLLADHDHVSFYAYPFTDLVHVHVWDRTEAPRSLLGARREAVNEAKAAVAAATFGDAMAQLGKLPHVAAQGMKSQSATNLVLRSHDAFSRSQYHLHQELEIAVPVERVWADLDETLAIYERMYASECLPFLLVEVRFSPAGHDRSLLGAGVNRASAWLCLCLNQSGRVGDYFDAIETWMRADGHEARTHLGKWCEHLDATDLARMHGDRFEQFKLIRARADPRGRFVNPFTERMFGPIEP
jgi:FAD/FMN-containing dehydrogenase